MKRSTVGNFVGQRLKQWHESQIGEDNAIFCVIGDPGDLFGKGVDLWCDKPRQRR